MQIVCNTEEASMSVLRILLAARLLPRRDYEVSLTLPITYTVRSAMPAMKLAKIRTVEDITVRTIA
jgi:hypothetical protein